MNDQDYRNMWKEVMSSIHYLNWVSNIYEKSIIETIKEDWMLWDEAGAPQCVKSDINEIQDNHKLHKQGKWFSMQTGRIHNSSK